MAPEENIQRAIQAVRGGQSIRKASEAWGVPFSTLRDRVNANAQPKGQYKAHVMQKLSPHQEKHLADWVLTQEALGLPVKHRQIEVFANRILCASGSNETVGKHWLQKFVRRYPVRIDPNTRFVQIEQIMQAKKALAKQLEPSETLDSYVFEDMCLEWSIFDPPVDTEKGGADGES